jgi:glucosamine-6-phosphate deaminase
MRRIVCRNAEELGKQAAEKGAELIRQALSQRSVANIILATGTSQIPTLAHLVEAKGINWRNVTAFHLDEYVGLPATHPASFRHYLKTRFGDKVPLRMFHYIHADAHDIHTERKRIGLHLARSPIDVAFLGIGENGHLAFNDPPADFETTEPFILVHLDRACRQQQVNEGWFEDLAAVPYYAITMSIPWIMQAGAIVCSVPDERKAEAVAEAVQGPVTPDVPASVLQSHPNCCLFLDTASASKIRVTSKL